MTNVFIIVNSPGEIEGWLKPVVKELKNLDFNILITVFIPPCRYSSGEECNIIKGISEVDNVVAPKDFIKYIIFSKINVEINKTDKGVIVFLGGDIIYGLLLKLKTKWPLIAYTMSFKPWPWSIFVNKYFTKKEIGNLMIDAFYKEGENTGIEEKTNKIKKIMLFSGRRKQHFKPFLPILVSTVKIIKEKQDRKSVV